MPPPPSILYVLYSSGVGGMETHCLYLAQEFARRGLRVGVVVPEPAVFDGLAAQFADAGAEVHRIDVFPRSGRRRQLSSLRRFAALCRTFRPGVVHFHTGDAVGGYAAVAIARAVTRATVVITEHEVPWPRLTRYVRLGIRAKDRLAHALVAVSRRNATIRQQRAPVPASKLFAVLNGVPLSGVTPTEQSANRQTVRARLGIRDDEVVLGTVVRLAEGKGLETLLRAAALVAARYAFRLVLVGDGPLRLSLEDQAASLGIESLVNFAGYQQDPGLFVDSMDAFILPVPAGTMSIALLEAMDRGVPPIITFGEDEEAVIEGETGLRARPDDPDDLARAIGELVGDAALRQRLGLAARSHVARHYSAARVADDLSQVYRAARSRTIPSRLRASSPPDRTPGDARG